MMFLTYILYREQWDHTFKTNIYPYFHICKHALPYLRKSKGCSIVNMTCKYSLLLFAP